MVQLLIFWQTDCANSIFRRASWFGSSTNCTIITEDFNSTDTLSFNNVFCPLFEKCWLKHKCPSWYFIQMSCLFSGAEILGDTSFRINTLYKWWPPWRATRQMSPRGINVTRGPRPRVTLIPRGVGPDMTVNIYYIAPKVFNCTPLPTIIPTVHPN